MIKIKLTSALPKHRDRTAALYDLRAMKIGFSEKKLRTDD